MNGTGRRSLQMLKLTANQATFASAGNADEGLTETLVEEGSRRMQQSITSPISLHPHRSIKEETPATYDAGATEKTPPGFVIVPGFVVELAREKRCGDITQVYAALATFANKARVCWPSRQTIADDSGVSLRNVQRCLNDLRNAGFIKVEHGRSRNIYTLLTVPNPHQSTQSESAKYDTVEEVTVPNQHVSVPNTTPESAKNDPQTISSRTKPSKNKIVAPDGDAQTKPEPKPTPTFELWRRWADRIGVPATVRMTPKDGKLAKQLVEQGLTPEQAIELYEWLAADPFWASKGVDLGIMLSNVGKWRSVRAASPTYVPDRVAEAKAEKERLLAGQWQGQREALMYAPKSDGPENLARRIAELDRIITGAVAA